MEINILSDAELLEKIEALKVQGFDQIKLPGGTSKDKKHFSACVIPFFYPKTKKTYFLGLPYNSSFYKTEGEKDTKKRGETPMQTAIREAMEETALILLEDGLEELTKAKFEVKDREDFKKVVHTKYFFLAKNFSGVAFEFDGPNAIDGETAAPLWIPADLFAKILWGGHQKAFKEALQVLSSDRQICMSIMNLL